MSAKGFRGDLLLMFGIFVGVILICALFVWMTWYFIMPYKYYSLSNDYNCSMVSGSLSGDGCIPHSDSRLGLIGCFSVDNMKFWYDNNCREPIVNTTPIPCINLYDANLSFSTGCCYPRNCWNYNDSCNHDCEYMIMCYDNWTFPTYFNFSNDSSYFMNLSNKYKAFQDWG